jgi:hypothetical protein
VAIEARSDKADRIVEVRVGFDETQLRQQVRGNGAA